jgi:hypothetical protein
MELAQEMFWIMKAGLPGIYLFMYWAMSLGQRLFTSPAG